ncbi:MAG: hypothetical protein GXO43_02105 [Crenarchaeota archaeon]|nr:hypothetical protein [Thermoproteota archaeon]
MSSKNPDEEIIEYMSKILDDIVILTNILLNGKILLSQKTSNPEEIIEKTIKQLCRDKPCMAHFRLCTDEKELGDVKIFILNGKVIGVIAEIAGKKFHGPRAQNILREMDTLGARYARVLLYSFPEEILPPQVSRIKTPSEKQGEEKPVEKKLEEEKQAEEKPGKTMVKQREERPPPREAIGKKLLGLNVPIISVGVTENPRMSIIDIVLDEECRLEQFNDIALIAAKQYIETKEAPSRKLKVVIHHRKTHAYTFDIDKEKDIIKILGKIPEIIWHYDLYIDKYKYKLKNNKLELLLTFKRGELYSTVNIADLVKEIYEAVKDYWPGEFILKAKIGAWGIEAKYPS